LVWVIRHGQTEWSRTGRHTSCTDVDLTPAGVANAKRLRGSVQADLVLCSPRLRARRTAELAGLTPFEVTEDLREWDYGELEGLTSAQIQETYPDWTIWDGPWPGGETAADVTARADRFWKEICSLEVESVALVGHGHFSRVLAARWVGEEVTVGRWLDLNTGTVSELGWSRGDRVLCRWNAPA
jgi:probable phosphoglycerate mutase